MLAALSLSTKILGRRWRRFLFSFFIQNSLDRVRESSLRVDMIKGERGSDSKVSLYQGSGTILSIRLTTVASLASETVNSMAAKQDGGRA